MIQGKTYSTGKNDGIKYVEIPKGWNRILENGSIQYISPSSSRLKSYEHVIEYLKAEGTCKCGLDCPFHVHRVFNFDTSVHNKEWKDELPTVDGKSSTCRLCDSNRLKGKSFVDQMLLQKPLNQKHKQAGKKTSKFSPIDGNLTSKKVSSRSRSKLSDGSKAKKSRKVSSPLSDIPSPPPIPISSPVQNVPNNLGALNQGPLPSFASIVSSSKFFNPGPNRGPLHPTGSLPLKTNNEFAFPKGVSNTVTPSTVSVVVTMAQNVITQVSDKKPVFIETFSSSTTTVPTVTSSLQSNNKPWSVNMSTFPTQPKTTCSTTVSLVTTVSTPILTESTCKTAVVPIISTPTLPSVFAPLDGIAPISTDTIKVPTKPPTKSKSRARPTPRARPKPKAEVKTDNKSKFGKGVGNTSPMIPPLTAVISSPAAATTLPASCQWPVPMSSVMNTIGQVSYQTPSTIVTTVSSVAKNVTSTTSAVSSYMAVSRQAMAHQSLPHQVTMPSIYMTTNYQGVGQTSSVAGSNLQSPQVLTNQSSSVVGSGKDSVVISPSIATPSSSYPVVATPRIQAPPGMMYVAAAPGIGMFPSNYPYVAASAQQLQISQASYSQQQNKSSSTTTTLTSNNQQPVTQGVASEAAQGKISFQVPGMYVQGTTTNQMFPINPQGFGVNQYKGPYQLQNAMYPSAVPGNAMAFITPNGTKAAYPGIQAVAAGNIGQFAYPNPYMFGIVMPTSTNQPSSVSVTSTGSSPSTPTCVATSLQMIHPQGLQNPAVAAAFESFVPIAPAAGGTAPRFAQTLAHLASAYNTFPSAGLVQGPNQLQLAYQMMHMNPHTNTQQVANLGGLVASDASSKHPVVPSVKQGQVISTSDTTKAVGNTQSKTHSVTPSPSASPVSTVPEDQGGGTRSPYASPPPNTASSLHISSPPLTVSAASVSQAHQSTTTKSDHLSHYQKPIKIISQEKCPEPALCSLVNVSSASTTTGLQSSSTCSETMRLHHETNSLWKNELTSTKRNNLSSNNTGKPVVTGMGSVSTDQSDELAVTQSPSHYSISPLQNQKKTLSSALSESDTSKKEFSSEVESQKYQHQVDNDITPVRTPNFPVEQKLNFPIEKTGQSNTHCAKSKKEKETPPNQVSTCTKGGDSKTRTIEKRDSIIPTNYVDKVNYYETNPLLGMKRSCEAIEVYPDPPDNCNEGDKEDYYSSNEECTEGHPFDDSTTDCVIDLRHGDSRELEEPFTISNQVHNTAKELYNGGCNETCNEQGIQSKFLGPNLKANQNLVSASFRPDMFGDLTIPHMRPHFDVGDVVWAQARGLPSWPGKIVDESKVGKGKPDDGKKWVMWFGDHTFSQVEVDRLKTLNEGLRTLDDKARKKKYRAKKARISLEQAISEALEELEMREQLKARQAGMRSKSKKKRLR